MKKAAMTALLLGLATLNAQTGPTGADGDRLRNIRETQAVVDSLYRSLALARHLPGLSYALVADGQVVYSSSFGYARPETKTLVSGSTVFRMASMTKSFTALAILQLRDAGKLQLDDPAERYIPALKSLRYPTADAPRITIRHLLTHTAGFPEDNPWGDRQLEATDSALLGLAAGASLSTTPGTAYEYSNLGFALLGRVITVVSGQPYQQYITQNILLPLGLRSTGWEYARVPAERLAPGYRWQDDHWEQEALLHDGAYGAMGGLLTTTEDFARYLSFQLQAWPSRNGKESPVARRATLRELQQPQSFSALNDRFAYASGRRCATVSFYAFGLRWLRDCEGKTFVGHSGGLPGYGSNWNILPDYGIGVVSFANGTYAPLGNLNLSVLDTIVHLAGLQPTAIPPSAILEQRQRELVELLPDWKGAERTGIFATNFFLDNRLSNLQREARRVLGGIGRLVRIGPLQAENALRGRFVLEGEKGKAAVYFTLSPEPVPKIQELRLTGL